MRVTYQFLFYRYREAFESSDFLFEKIFKMSLERAEKLQPSKVFYFLWRVFPHYMVVHRFTMISETIFYESIHFYLKLLKHIKLIVFDIGITYGVLKYTFNVSFYLTNSVASVV